MQKIAVRIKMEFPSVRFLTAVVNGNYADKLCEKADPQLKIEIRQTSIEVVTRYADLAVVASGTATLEVAAQHCPMIVMYHVSRLHWHLAGRWIVRSKYISLVNILADKELVPEFIPCTGRTRAIADKAVSLLKDVEQLKKIRNNLLELVGPIVKPGASEKVVGIIKEMLPKY